MRWLVGITDSMDMNLSKPREIVKDRGAWRATVHGLQRVRRDLANEQQQHTNYKIEYGIELYKVLWTLLLLLSHSVMSDSLRPHWLQHSRPP